jgi:hypothetical protein
MARSVELLGEREISAALEGIERDVTLYGKVGKAAAQIVAGAAASYGPNRSGDLSKSYKGMGGKTQGRVVSRVKHGKGRTGDSGYAPVIEYGWPSRGIAPQKRVERALKAKETVVRALFEDHVRKAIAAKGMAK